MTARTVELDTTPEAAKARPWVIVDQHSAACERFGTLREAIEVFRQHPLAYDFYIVRRPWPLPVSQEAF